MQFRRGLLLSSPCDAERLFRFRRIPKLSSAQTTGSEHHSLSGSTFCFNLMDLMEAKLVLGIVGGIFSSPLRLMAHLQLPPASSSASQPLSGTRIAWRHVLRAIGRTPPDRKRVNVDLAGRVGGVSAASAISWVTDWPGLVVGRSLSGGGWGESPIDKNPAHSVTSTPAAKTRVLA